MLYLTDLGHNRVRRILPDGIIQTFAGTGAATDTTHPPGDGGHATAATLNQPGFLAIGGTSLYVNDLGNYRIRRIFGNGIITTVAGNGAAAGPDGAAATNVGLGSVNGFDVDASGAIYFGLQQQLFPAEATANTIRRIAADGTISTIAGVGDAPRTNLGDGGPALQASLNQPLEVRVGPNGVLVVSGRITDESGVDAAVYQVTDEYAGRSGGSGR